MSKTDDTLLTPKAVAEWLGVSERTLRRWRKKECGPYFVRLTPRGSIRYRRGAVNAFLQIGFPRQWFAAPDNFRCLTGPTGEGMMYPKEFLSEKESE